MLVSVSVQKWKCAVELDISNSEHLLKQTKNPTVITRQYLKKFLTLYQEIMHVALWLADRNVDVD